MTTLVPNKLLGSDHSTSGPGNMACLCEFVLNCRHGHTLGPLDWQAKRSRPHTLHNTGSISELSCALKGGISVLNLGQCRHPLTTDLHVQAPWYDRSMKADLCLTAHQHAGAIYTACPQVQDLSLSSDALRKAESLFSLRLCHLNSTQMKLEGISPPIQAWLAQLLAGKLARARVITWERMPKARETPKRTV